MFTPCRSDLDSERFVRKVLFSDNSPASVCITFFEISACFATHRSSGDWLDALVRECRSVIEEGFAEEQAEEGVLIDDESAEEGWNSDPEELAQDAARKLVRSCVLTAGVCLSVSLFSNTITVAIMVMKLSMKIATYASVCFSSAAVAPLPCYPVPVPVLFFGPSRDIIADVSKGKRAGALERRIGP